jgi:hypothetical protein
MTQVPQKPLVPNNTLITKTAEEGRALAIMLARNSIHAMQGELETLKTGRAQYAHDPYGLIAAAMLLQWSLQPLRRPITIGADSASLIGTKSDSQTATRMSAGEAEERTPCFCEYTF